MDKILLNDMEFYGYHGALQEENKLGQRFRVNAELLLDLQPAGKSDQLEETVNYAEIYNLCKLIVEGKPNNLIETVAEKIAEGILGQFSKVEKCKVTVVKPDPPIPGHYSSVAVEITRSR
jgi:7,8-dihydroneopterin aldolase/epimerase/oxygenase